MPFNFVSGVYTPPTGATNATPGQLIASATWNTIHGDLSAALSNVGQFLWSQTTVFGSNYTVNNLDGVVFVTGSAPNITLPASANKAGPVVLVGSAPGIFASSPSTVFLTAGDTFNGSPVSPCFTLNANYQAQIFYPLPSGGYVNAVGSVISFNGRSGAVVLQSSDVAPFSGITYTRQSKINSYTVLSGDSGTNLALSGGIFYTVTFPAASGFSGNFAVVLTNEEAVSGGRAKFIAGVNVDGRSGFYLWPGQSVIVYNSNNQWLVTGRGRFRPQAGNLTFFVNTASGTDVYGATDGLGTGTNAFATVGGLASNIWIPEIDLATFNNITLTASISGTHTVAINFIGAGGMFNEVGPAIVLDGGGTAVITGGISAFFGWHVKVQNMTITTLGLQAQMGGMISIGPGVVFGACPGQQHMFVYNKGSIRTLSGYTITGGAVYHFLVNLRGFIDASVGTVSISGSPAFSGAVLFNQNGTFINSGSWVGGTPTGSKYVLTYNSVSFNASLVPGTIAGSFSTGAQFT